MKFSILTPTIVRPTLIQMCESIDNQNYKDIQHIIMVDSKEELLTEEKKNILKQIERDYREIHYTDKADNTNDYGNRGKMLAQEYVTGEYCLFMDDDDIYLNNPFIKLEYFIKQNNYPDLIIFPGLRYGARFFNIPAGRTRTLANQICFKPKWKFKATMEYEQDGIFLEEIMHTKDINIKYFDSIQNLVDVKLMSRGL